MITVKLSDLFDISRGVRLTKAEQELGDIPLVTAGEDNYGINGYISNGKSDIFEDVITVDMFCHAVYRDYKFYCDDNIIVLIPKKEMTLNEKLYYALCISQNKYKFGYGRQLRLSRLDEIVVPLEIPLWVYELEKSDLSCYKDSFNSNKTPELNTSEWQKFKISDLFDIIKGNNPTRVGEEKVYPYVSSTASNNGISDYKESKKYHPGNVLTVSANGACMDTFYQPDDFISCGDANVLYPIYKGFNQYIAMFLIPILELHKFRFGYGRKSNSERIKQITIKLPTKNNAPDYEFMEEYIKTLPYSKHI